MAEAMKALFARFWRRYILDEDPEEKRERIRRERIGSIKASVGLLEQMNQWDRDRCK
jgi:hypothetical protein